MQPNPKCLIVTLCLLAGILVSGCDLITSDRDDFTKLAGFEPPNSVQILKVENTHYAPEGIGFQASFNVTGNVIAIAQFCQSMNLTMFRQ